MNNRFWLRGMILTVLIFLLAGWLAWRLPEVRQAFIRIFFPPVTVSLPALISPNTIAPENVQNIQMLNHWGNGEFKSMAWSSDENYFGIGTTLGVNLYDGNSLQLLRYIELSIGGIDSLAFSPDNSLLAVASDGGAITIYDLHGDRIVNQLQTEGWVSALSFVEDGTPVAVTFPYGSAYQARVMKEMNGEWETVALMGNATNQLYAAAFDQASQLFVIEFRNSIELVDPLTGIAQTAPGSDLNGDAYLPSNALWLEPKGDGLSLGVHSSGKLLNTISFEDYFDRVLISPNGRSFAVLDHYYRDDMIGGSIALWQVPELREIRKIGDPNISQDVEDNSPDGKNYMVFSPSGERLALWTSTSVVKIFPVVANSVGDVVITDPYAGITDIGITLSGQIRGMRCTSNTVDVVELPAANSLNEWQFDKPTCGQITRDGGIASINKEYNQHLYKVGENNSPIATLKTLCCDVFSSDGTVGASGGTVYSGEPVPVWIWQKGFGTQLWQFPDSGLGTYSVSVSPSGQYVAAVVGDQTRLWVKGIETGRYLPAFSRWPKTAFSPDEKHLASADAIMDLETGRSIIFEGMENIFERMGKDLCTPSVYSTPAFSPDGKLVVAQVCGVLKFWSPSTSKLLNEIDDPYLSTKFIFSPDGTFLIGFAPGSVVVWGIPEQSR